MNFTEAVSSVFSKYATFSGRATRPEFWWFTLFNIIASLLTGLIDGAVFGREVISIVYGLAVLLPALAVAVRRLHDIGRSGWWVLIGIVPVIGWILLVYWYANPGTPATNEYGPPST